MKIKSNVIELLLFEFQSFIGRIFFKTRPELNSDKNYLNLGCGDNIIKGFVNADFFYKTWKKTNLKKEWMLDLRYELDCNNNVFDGIYTEHTIEHLDFNSAERLLKECYRILKKGSYIRITVPDCDKYINFYNNIDDKNINKKFHDEFSSQCAAMSSLTQSFGHLSVWNFSELRRILRDIGFTNIKQMKFQQSRDQMLKNDIQEREWETLYIEALK